MALSSTKNGRLSLLCSILVVLAIFLSVCLSSSATETNSPSQGLMAPESDKSAQYGSHHEAQNVARRSAIGSSPPNCLGICRGCTPCKPKMVRRPPRADHEDDPPYYPLVWRCKCGGNAYRPRHPPLATHSSLGRP